MFAVIRIRGKVGVRKEVEDTLQMLRLKAANNCVLLAETEDYRGMLNKVKDFVTWGEIKKETLEKMLEKRLRTEGDRRFDKKILKDVTGFDDYGKLADELIAGKIKLRDFEKVKSIFRLTPPSKGFKSIRDAYPKGDLGYRKEEINELIERMI
jgi:large subunit ribosomal protein L30